jgi:predicted membrane-bound dolichyl-phosphate-mannose-protein mannosyltransferase
MFQSPLTLLAILVALSLAARAALLDEPCRTPCRSAADHVLVFDEDYYVNAARVIAGIHPPPNARYATAPSGSDPNAEHPQLAKLLIAGSIELFGDGPFAWRIGSLVFGSLALLGLYALVRAAGGGPWIALGASALMAADNLLLVHGRIGTLDIYAVSAMIWAAVAYLRGRPLLAGTLVGIGACFKEVAPYVLIMLGVFELLRVARGRGTPAFPWRRLLGCAVVAAVVFLAGLAAMDAIARPYDAGAGRFVAAGPFAHLRHIISFASAQSSPRGPGGIASYPWQWLGDYKPIVYLNINPAEPTPELYGIHPPVHFLGMISPPLMLLALPALLLCTWRARIGRVRSRTVDEVELIALAWFVATWVPFELLSLIGNRTSYLYYMVIVMPGIYLAVARLVARLRARRWLVGIWGLAILVAAVLMYPFTPLP